MTRYESIERLYKLSLNVPEVLINLPKPKDLLEYEKYRAQLGVMNKVIREKRLKTVVSSNDNLDTNNYIPSSELSEELDKHEYGKEGIMLIKAPKTAPVASGLFVPSNTHFAITFDGSTETKKYVWGMFSSFPEHRYDVVADISDHVNVRRNELDGFSIYFTYHDEPEGVLSNYLVLWGFKQFKYIEA